MTQNTNVLRRVALLYVSCYSLYEHNRKNHYFTEQDHAIITHQSQRVLAELAVLRRQKKSR
jgi:hypothetical protein